MRSGMATRRCRVDSAVGNRAYPPPSRPPTQERGPRRRPWKSLLRYERAIRPTALISCGCSREVTPESLYSNRRRAEIVNHHHCRLFGAGDLLCLSRVPFFETSFAHVFAPLYFEIFSLRKVLHLTRPRAERLMRDAS